ncbi:MAG: hypothetical protein PHI35_05855 [Victivallaceae bacterium]|nr:hypothetical protein [Victivallaceae bacterium]
MEIKTFFSAAFAAAALLCGCDGGSDEERTPEEIRKLAADMSYEEIEERLAECADKIEDVTEELKDKTEELSEIPISEQLGDEAKKLQLDISRLGESLKKLQRNMQAYADTLKNK